MIRKVWPRSTEPSHTLRCVPVPVGRSRRLAPGIDPNVRLAVRVDRIHHGWHFKLDGRGVCAGRGNVQRSVEVRNQCQEFEPTQARHDDLLD